MMDGGVEGHLGLQFKLSGSLPPYTARTTQRAYLPKYCKYSLNPMEPVDTAIMYCSSNSWNPKWRSYSCIIICYSGYREW